MFPHPLAQTDQSDGPSLPPGPPRPLGGALPAGSNSKIWRPAWCPRHTHTWIGTPTACGRASNWSGGTPAGDSAADLVFPDDSGNVVARSPR